MINPNNEIFKWGPIDGRPIYSSPWVRGFLNFPKIYGISWVENYNFFKDDKVTYFSEDKPLRDYAEIVFKKFMLSKKYLEILNKWKFHKKKIFDFEKTINQGLDKHKDDELNKLFIDWDRNLLDFWYYGFLPEFSNWGGERLLKEKLLKYNKIHFIEIFETLTAPEELSFFQLEEKELIELKLNFSETGLKNHQQKYYWIRNNYAYTKVLDLDFFRYEIQKIKNPKKKLEEIKNYPISVKKKKIEVIKKYRLSDEIVNIGNMVTYNICWQDYRKKFIFIANHIITVFLEEISKRKNIEFKNLCYYLESELNDLLKNNKKTNVKNRFNGFLMHYKENDKLYFYEGIDAYKRVKPFIEFKIDKSQKKFSGIVVSKGKTIKAHVKILDSPMQMEKMNEGDILVCAMTSPDYIIAMRKASAIITDVGGITQHAAIVSRELGIPCIVGTKIATKLLNDNTIVEVDTKKGEIRICK